MSDKNKMVDFPDYDPNVRVPFPPPDPEEQAKQAREAEAERFASQGLHSFSVPPDNDMAKDEAEAAAEPKKAKRPFYETYHPDPASPDPSQTMPGAPDIRDPDTKLAPDADLSALSPDIDLKE